MFLVEGLYGVYGVYIFNILNRSIFINLIFVVPCIMLNSEIIPR